MSAIEKPRAAIPPLVIALGIGLFVFAVALDLSILNPRATDWCFEWDSDLRVYFLGFAYYRHAPWQFPVTAFDSVFHPVGTNIVMMDALPLVAVPLKVFDGILPDPLQYFGPWLFVCVWLQAYFTWRILHHLGVSSAVAWAASLLAASAPAFVGRFGHTALSAHWLLLASIGASVGALPRFALWLLPVMACWVHPYILVMVLALCAVGHVRFRKTSGARVRIAACVLGVALSVWLLGYGTLSQTRAGGYEYYVSDLLTFFDPNRQGTLIPSDRALPGEIEGAAYLGLGGIALLLVLGWSLRRPEVRRKLRENWLLPSVCVAMALFAITAAPRVLGHSTFRIGWLSDLLEPIGSRFRATGRFIWPLYYCVLIFGAAAFDRIASRRRLAGPAAAALLLVQGVDLGPWLVKRGRNPDLVAPAKLPPVPEDVQAQVRRGARLLLFVPPVKTRCGSTKWTSPYFHFAMLGAQAKLKTNANFRQARTSPEEEALVCRFTSEVLNHLDQHPGTIVIRDDRDVGTVP